MADFVRDLAAFASMSLFIVSISVIALGCDRDLSSVLRVLSNTQ